MKEVIVDTCKIDLIWKTIRNMKKLLKEQENV